MTHVYHEGLDGFVEGAIFQDGCEECETRAARFSLSHMDPTTWARARARALTLQRGGLDKVSQCEVPVLRVIGDVLIREGLRVTSEVGSVRIPRPKPKAPERPCHCHEHQDEASTPVQLGYHRFSLQTNDEGWWRWWCYCAARGQGQAPSCSYHSWLDHVARCPR